MTGLNNLNKEPSNEVPENTGMKVITGVIIVIAILIILFVR